MKTQYKHKKQQWVSRWEITSLKIYFGSFNSQGYHGANLSLTILACFKNAEVSSK